MKKPKSVEEYIENHPKYSDGLQILREICLKTELEESIKWNAPVYSLEGKNVLGLGAFKNHFGIWFFNGVLLGDRENVLQNAQQEKTKALRQMRFNSIEEINPSVVSSYVREAIENQKNDRVFMPKRNTSSKIDYPEELLRFLEDNPKIKKAFASLSPYKQKEYAEYIGISKRETTKQSRLEKITPMILKGIGLNDKYK